MKLQKLIGRIAWQIWDYISFPNWRTPNWIISWSLTGIRKRDR